MHLEVHLFFFSSRRRHTSSLRDWSSDVCSSDLSSRVPGSAADSATATSHHTPEPGGKRCFSVSTTMTQEIGRASCRERVYKPGVVELQKKPTYCRKFRPQHEHRMELSEHSVRYS